MLLVRQLPAMRIEFAGGTLVTLRNSQIPGLSGLDRTASGSILRRRIVGLVLPWLLLGTEPKTHICGQPLEQCAGIPRLGVVSFFGLK